MVQFISYYHLYGLRVSVSVCHLAWQASLLDLAQLAGCQAARLTRQTGRPRELQNFLLFGLDHWPKQSQEEEEEEEEGNYWPAKRPIKGLAWLVNICL